MKIEINGRALDIDAPPDTPLLWIIREEAKLLGTKFGCGRALCGACTVHVDGEARRSCVLSVGDVVGKKVTTIEGLAGPNGGLHPVQQAWIDENAPQCGYCQSGQIMSATALLAKKKAPTDAEIDSVMSANICRCGTYPRIRAAIHRAAKAMQR
jgi:isoquinoline 1-oxidoreductase alpha subunit